MTYHEQLKSPLWQKKRLEIMQRDGFKCKKCAAHDIQLHIHHVYYVSGRMAWEYPNFSLETLCVNCHSDEKDGGDLGDAKSMKNWELLLGVFFEVDESCINFALAAAKCKYNLEIPTSEILSKAVAFIESGCGKKDS